MSRNALRKGDFAEPNYFPYLGSNRTSGVIKLTKLLTINDNKTDGLLFFDDVGGDFHCNLPGMFSLKIPLPAYQKSLIRKYDTLHAFAMYLLITAFNEAADIVRTKEVDWCKEEIVKQLKNVINKKSEKLFISWINLRDGPNAELTGGKLLYDKIKYCAANKLPGENAIEFYERIYGDASGASKITLSELYKIDQKLWRAVQNWARNAKTNLDERIERGRTRRGPERIDEADHPDAVLIASLDLSDKRDMLAYQTLKRRARNRTDMRRKRDQGPRI